MNNDELYPLIRDAIAKPYDYLPQFEDLVQRELFDAVNNGNLAQANDVCVSLLKQGCSDLRILVLAIYSSDSWLDKAGMLDLFTTFHHWLIDQPAELMAPSNRLSFETFFDQQLGWLFRKIKRKIEHLTHRQSSDWLTFIHLLDGHNLSILRSEMNAFAQVLSRGLPASDQQSLLAIQGLIQIFSEIELAVLPDTVIEDLTGKESDSHPLIDELTSESLQAEQSQIMKPLDLQLCEAEQNTGAISALRANDEVYLLIELRQKFDCFQHLLDQQDYLKAAIVASDIKQLIEDFDPRQYFPSLFKPFLQGQIQHMADLQQAQMTLQHQDIQPVMDLYQSDRQAFMALPIEGPDLDSQEWDH